MVFKQWQKLGARSYDLFTEQGVLEELSKPSFWWLHVLGWLCYVLIFSIDNLVFGELELQVAPLLSMLFLSGLTAALLTLPLRYLYRRCWNLSLGSLVLVIVFACALVAGIWTPIKNSLSWYLLNGFNVFEPGDIEFSFLKFLGSSGYAFCMILAWSCLYFSINYHFRLRQKQEALMVVSRLSHVAQIKMLRYQINPHFLFNTLNAISTLVLLGKKECANRMLTKLASFLRFSLDNDPERLIFLQEEIEALQLYLDIEKVRFQERLQIDINIEPSTASALVSGLLLQPLVENAIKYGIGNMRQGGRIAISSQQLSNRLYLTVFNNGPVTEFDIVRIRQSLSSTSSDEVSTSGIGLKNIKDRIHILFDGDCHFDVLPVEPTGLKVEIQIPIIPPNYKL
ncbi:sensor histidine kinase [Planctobacterium marinum]|uniref:Sensor histidine kinase n=1 Tax=Planctobacterium marinum TaxID=1631968 RepID=A0AA48HPC7_9ALTE|nr:hypothetical protein MACH26_40220 [Planctobacterium marinum]